MAPSVAHSAYVSVRVGNKQVFVFCDVRLGHSWALCYLGVSSELVIIVTRFSYNNVVVLPDGITKAAPTHCSRRILVVTGLDVLSR